MKILFFILCSAIYNVNADSECIKCSDQWQSIVVPGPDGTPLIMKIPPLELHSDGCIQIPAPQLPPPQVQLKPDRELITSCSPPYRQNKEECVREKVRLLRPKLPTLSKSMKPLLRRTKNRPPLLLNSQNDESCKPVLIHTPENLNHASHSMGQYQQPAASEANLTEQINLLSQLILHSASPTSCLTPEQINILRSILQASSNKCLSPENKTVLRKILAQTRTCSCRSPKNCECRPGNCKDCGCCSRYERSLHFLDNECLNSNSFFNSYENCHFTKSRKKRDLGEHSYKFLMNMLPQFVREPLHHSIRGVKSTKSSFGPRQWLETINMKKEHEQKKYLVSWSSPPKNIWGGQFNKITPPIKNIFFEKQNQNLKTPLEESSITNTKNLLKNLKDSFLRGKAQNDEEVFEPTAGSKLRLSPYQSTKIPKLSPRQEHANEKVLLKKLKKLNGNPFSSNLEDQATKFIKDLFHPVEESKKKTKDVTKNISRKKRTIIVSSDELDLPAQYEVKLVSVEDEDPVDHEYMEDEEYEGESGEEYDEEGPIVGTSLFRRRLPISPNRRMYPFLPKTPDVLVGQNAIQKAVRDELNAYHRKLEKEKRMKDFKQGLQRKQKENLVPHNPIFLLLTAPMKFLKHFHDLNKGANPIMTSLPKLVYTTKKYFRDFGKNFQKNCLNLASDVIGDFDHVSPSVIQEIPEFDAQNRYRRNVLEEELRKCLKESIEEDKMIPQTSDTSPVQSIRKCVTGDDTEKKNFSDEELRKCVKESTEEDKVIPQTSDTSPIQSIRKFAIGNDIEKKNFLEEELRKCVKENTEEDTVIPQTPDTSPIESIRQFATGNDIKKTNFLEEKLRKCVKESTEEDKVIPQTSDTSPVQGIRKFAIGYDIKKKNFLEDELRKCVKENTEEDTVIPQTPDTSPIQSIRKFATGNDIKKTNFLEEELRKCVKESTEEDKVIPQTSDTSPMQSIRKCATGNDIKKSKFLEEELRKCVKDPTEEVKVTSQSPDTNSKKSTKECATSSDIKKSSSNTNAGHYTPDYTPVFENSKEIQNFRKVPANHVRKKRYIVKVVDENEVHDQVQDYLVEKMDGKLNYLKPLQDYYDRVTELVGKVHSTHQPQGERGLVYRSDDEYNNYNPEEYSEDFLLMKPKKKKIQIKKVKPRVIVDNKGLPFLEYDGYKRPLILKGKKSQTFRDNEDKSSEETGNKIVSLISRAKQNPEIVGSSNKAIIPQKIIKERISSLLDEIDELVHLDPEAYDEIYENLIKIQHIKNSIEQDWKRLLINNKINDITAKIGLLNKFRDLQEAKDNSVKIIAKALNENKNEFVRRHLIHSLIRLQKLQCLIRRFVDDFEQNLKMGAPFSAKKEIRCVDFLSDLTFVYESKTRNDLIKNLCKDRDTEGQKKIEMLHKLKKILALAESDMDRTDDVAKLLWEMKNLEKLQTQTIKDMNTKLSKHYKIRKELLILFDLQRRFEDCQNELDELHRNLSDNKGMDSKVASQKKDVKEIVAEIKQKHEAVMEKLKLKHKLVTKFH